MSVAKGTVLSVRDAESEMMRCRSNSNDALSVRNIPFARRLQWREADGAVWYDILAFSRPRQLPARLGYPLARRLQKRFARGSAAAMQRAVVEGTSTAQVKSDFSPG